MKRGFWILLALISIVYACKEAFDPRVTTGVTTNYLIVEGVINTAGPTNISLTRTLQLSDKLAAKTELKAAVQVEGETSGVFPLTEAGNGIYSIASLNLNAAQKYRLRIKTAAGKIYLSDFVPVKTTPAIDSINWVRNNDGVQIYANAHDVKKETRYYQWDYDEAWEIHSSAESYLKLDHVGKRAVVVPRDAVETGQMYVCYRQQKSTNIFINSTAKLTDDVVYLSPLLLIPNGTDKLGVRYSMLVRQHALTKEAFEYLSLMKKNSEQVGSLFDSQPTEIKGNIYNTADPNEMVIGYVQVASVIEKRIFINAVQVPKWNSGLVCFSKAVPNIADSLELYFSSSYTPVIDDQSTMPPTIFGITQICMDCRLRGGTNVKPSFW